MWTPLTAFAVAYTIYALAGLIWLSLEEAGHPEIALLIDTIFFGATLTGVSPHAYWVTVFFYSYLLVITTLLHDWFKVVLVSAVALLSLNFLHPAQPYILLPALITGGMVATVVALERQFLKERLDGVSRQSVLYRYDAEKARESERQRIAADFHDGPLQQFISIQMRLEVIRRLLARDPQKAEEELNQLQELWKGQVTELRAFVRSMRPVEVDGSLNTSIRRVVEQFQKESGIPASFVSTDVVEFTEPEVALELLQIVREALNNVQKHSGATRVAVSIQKTNNALEIFVEDNGHGFPFSGSYNLDELELLRLGPNSIKHRVRTLGGELLLDSKPGQGTGLKIRLRA
jgi:signal transduction histidine kinase